MISQAEAHSLFNSAEETMGGYRVQIATLPEFPQIGEKSQLLFRVTDYDYNEIDEFTMGVRIFFGDQQINAFRPEVHKGSHWETDFVFQGPGIHLVKVDLYNMESAADTLTFTFNISTQSPFGYIFLISITMGAGTLAIVVCYIYIPKLLKKRAKH